MESALKTHIGNPTFINNYAYTLALDGQVELAENIITKVKKNNNLPTDITDICITATRGMIAFRKGDAKMALFCILTLLIDQEIYQDIQN